MNYTTLPSYKGQITIPSVLRVKYKISKNTPIIIKDNEDGTMTMKVMEMTDPNDIIYREDENSIGLSFKNGIDPRVLIDAIKKIDG
jgi:bifunctional DNA-binding transcriptional regulator/antitoxin component of YhaV-PrlF toxin-antitoxin module